MRKEKEGNEEDPEGTEATIYDLASRDWLAGVGGTCFCLHFSLTMANSWNYFLKKTKTKPVLNVEGSRRLLK